MRTNLCDTTEKAAASRLLYLLEIVASKMMANRTEKNYSGRVITE